MDARDRSIVRQVAFKGAVEIAAATTALSEVGPAEATELVASLTDKFESIILSGLTGGGDTSPFTSSASGGSGGSKYPSTPPKADEATYNSLPKTETDAGVIVDQRPLKDQGIYKNGAADFKNVTSGKQYWLRTRDGDPKQSDIEELASLGVEVF